VGLKGQGRNSRTREFLRDEFSSKGKFIMNTVDILSFYQNYRYTLQTIKNIKKLEKKLKISY
jgi:hypothetical protein